VLVDPASAIVGVRSFGSDPQLVARQVAGFVEGLQSVGVAACAKHFPGHGETVADSHLELPSSDASLDVLRERALPPFAAAVEAGVRAVMTAHIRFGAFGDEPATWNSAVIELLRTELADGVVMTDALECRAPAAGEAALGRARWRPARTRPLGAALTPEQVEGVHAAIVLRARGAARRGRGPSRRARGLDVAAPASGS
jgi:beta-N-acetylhexosaminidase